MTLARLVAFSGHPSIGRGDGCEYVLWLYGEDEAWVCRS